MTATVPQAETALPQYIADFFLKAHDLFGRQRTMEIVDGERRIIFRASPYDEVADDLAGQTGTRNGSVARSLPPVHLSALKFLLDVETETTKWATTFSEVRSQVDRNGYRAPHIIDALSAHSYRPQDGTELARMTGKLVEWTDKARTLLGENPTYHLRAACPNCEVETVRRQDDSGQWVNVPALTLTPERARCQHCDQVWLASSFGLLGKLLGCEAIDGFTPAD